MSIQIQIGADISGVDKAIDSVSGSLGKLKAPAVNAQAALFSVSQVTRDLPFGFIAIQNNLPLVVDSFSQLTKQAGGLGPALKSLGGALIGPAGLSFAFGAIVAGVTALIQKYGSLGEALSQILGSTNKITKEQKLFNDEVAKATGNVAAEEAKVNILTKTLLDNEKPQKDRVAAYRELKKIAPDVVAGIKEENVGTEISNTLIDSNAKKRIELIKLKIRESGINAVLSKNSEDIAIQQDKLNQLIAERSTLLDKQKKGGIYVDPETGKEFDVLSSVIAENEKRLVAQRIAVEKLYSVNSNFLSQLDPIVTGISNINSETEDRINKLKEQEGLEKKLTKTLDQQRKEGWQGIIDKLKEVDALAKQTQQSNERVAAVNAKLLQDKAAQNRAAALKKQTEETKKAEQAALDLAIAEGERQYQAPPLFEGFKDLAPRLVQETNAAAGLELFKSSFTSPLEGLFSSFLETGKITFKDFGKIVLQTINQLVAKIVATGIINLLGSILFPGASAAAGVGKGIGGAFTSALGSLFGFNFGGGVAAPSFAGVGAGQMGMSGQVNVVLRGQDLVGAINRTNSTINRVG